MASYDDYPEDHIYRLIPQAKKVGLRSVIGRFRQGGYESVSEIVDIYKQGYDGVFLTLHDLGPKRVAKFRQFLVDLEYLEAE